MLVHDERVVSEIVGDIFVFFLYVGLFVDIILIEVIRRIMVYVELDSMQLNSKVILLDINKIDEDEIYNLYRILGRIFKTQLPNY